MIRLALRQFRTEGVIGLGVLVVARGGARRHGRAPRRRKPGVPEHLQSSGRLRIEPRAQCGQAAAGRLADRRRCRASPHRALSRRAPRRSRVRERDIPSRLDPERDSTALGGAEVRARRLRGRGDRRTPHLDGRLVGAPDSTRRLRTTSVWRASASMASSRSAMWPLPSPSAPRRAPCFVGRFRRCVRRSPGSQRRALRSRTGSARTLPLPCANPSRSRLARPRLRLPGDEQRLARPAGGGSPKRMAVFDDGRRQSRTPRPLASTWPMPVRCSAGSRSSWPRRAGDPRQQALDRHSSIRARRRCLRPSTRFSRTNRRTDSGPSSGPSWGSSSPRHWRSVRLPTGRCTVSLPDFTQVQRGRCRRRATNPIIFARLGRARSGNDRSAPIGLSGWPLSPEHRVGVLAAQEACLDRT